MIVVQWSCEVPEDKREDFISFAEKKLKSFYESCGALRYEIFFPMNTEKK